MSATKYLVSALALLALACGGSDKASGGGDENSEERDRGSERGNMDGGTRGNDAGKDGSRASSGNEQDSKPTGGEDAKPTGDDLKPSAGKGDAGSTSTIKPTQDGGVSRPRDAAVPADGGGLQGTGSCCAEHPTPGCNNADLQVCVCEKDPSCCEKGWGRQCALIVAQKYCQANVRECVCGSGNGQWGQARCCDTDWSESCDSVAELKCNAVAGCF